MRKMLVLKAGNLRAAAGDKPISIPLIIQPCGMPTLLQERLEHFEASLLN